MLRIPGEEPLVARNNMFGVFGSALGGYACDRKLMQFYIGKHFGTQRAASLAERQPATTCTRCCTLSLSVFLCFFRPSLLSLSALCSPFLSLFSVVFCLFGVSVAPVCVLT